MIAMAGREVGCVLHDVGREDHHHVFADLASRFRKRLRLFRIETGGGLINDDQVRVTDQRLGDAEALAHPAGKTCERLLRTAQRLV